MRISTHLTQIGGPILSKEPENKNIHLVKGKSFKKVLPKRNDMTKDSKWVGTDKVMSVKLPTSNSQRGHTKWTNSPLKPNALLKPLWDRILRKVPLRLERTQRQSK